jgi:hypothetical protein
VSITNLGLSIYVARGTEPPSGVRGRKTGPGSLARRVQEKLKALIPPFCAREHLPRAHSQKKRGIEDIATFTVDIMKLAICV